MGFWSSQGRLLRRVLEVRAEKAGLDGPKDRVRSPWIPYQTVSQGTTMLGGTKVRVEETIPYFQGSTFTVS